MINCIGIELERGGAAILQGCDLTVMKGQHLVLTGPSGAGKTALLRVIAGLETPRQGRVVLGDRAVTVDGTSVVPPQDRSVGMVFQDLGLWPSLTVEQHLQAVMRRTSGGAMQRRERIRNVLDGCHLRGFERRRPPMMSGGEQQRLALARCLVAEPRWLLLDEPFVGLDIFLREELCHLIHDLRRVLELTIITVTHLPWDAFSLRADRIAVMESGRVVESFHPKESTTGVSTSQTRSLWQTCVAGTEVELSTARGAGDDRNRRSK